MANCAPCTDSGFLRFNRVGHYGKSNIIQRLEYGLKFFYEWALLGIGAWTDVNLNQLTVTSGNASTLRMGSGWGYTPGSVWEGFRHNWVYETGVTYTDYTGGTHSPLAPLVYVDSVLQTSGYTINHPLGQVIFTTPLTSANVVKTAFSFKNVQVYISYEAPWYQELQTNSWDVDSMFTYTDRGDWFVGPNHRIQMPCIVISSIGTGEKLPYSIGGGYVYRKQEVAFNIFAEDKGMRDNLADLIVTEGDRCIQLIDIDEAAADQNLTLNNNGAVIGMMYPDILANYCWATARSSKARITGMNSYSCGLHESVVRINYEVLFSNLV